jgi:signal transduction histidine kinase
MHAQARNEAIGVAGQVRKCADLRACSAAPLGPTSVVSKTDDSLGQELSALKLIMESSQSNFIRNSDPVRAKKSFASCVNLLDTSIRNLRDICFNLLPESLNQGNLEQALKEFVMRLNNQQSVKIILNIDAELTKVNPDIALNLFRVVQEFFSNTFKYANASKINLSLKRLGKVITLSIEDNGKGFDTQLTSNQNGRGLVSMRTRAKAFKGKYKLLSSIGKGTRLNLAVEDRLQSKKQNKTINYETINRR